MSEGKGQLQKTVTRDEGLEKVKVEGEGEESSSSSSSLISHYSLLFSLHSSLITQAISTNSSTIVRFSDENPTGGQSPITAPRIGYTPPFSASCYLYRPHHGNAPPSARAPRAAVPSLFAFLMSLSLSALIRPSMRSIQLALYPQAAPGSPLLPFGGSGFTVRSPMRLSALANRAPCNVSPSAFYASDNPSASSLSFSTQIQLNR